MMPSSRSETTQLLIIFLGIIATLITIGFIFIYSSSSIFALEHHGSPHYFVIKQCMGLIIGIIGLIICRLIPSHLIQRLTPALFLGSLALTALTLIPGIGVMIHGSRRWLAIGPFGLQPSEFLKLTCIMYIAYVLAKKRYRLASFFHGYLPFLCILGITSLVLLKQPDFGQMITLCLTAFLLFFCAQVTYYHLIGTIALIIPIASLLVYLKPYRFQRVLIFLDPWQDPQGAGFQIIQSLIAIGSGHLGGVGIAQSKQKFFYLPMQHTDFIFAIIAEETGFLGSCVLIALYVSLAFFGIKLAYRLKNLFSSYVVLGFVFLITIQATINLCVATGLLPTKGLGLPFISFGSSALVANLCMLGIVINSVYAPEDTPSH